MIGVHTVYTDCLKSKDYPIIFSHCLNDFCLVMQYRTHAHTRLTDKKDGQGMGRQNLRQSFQVFTLHLATNESNSFLYKKYCG